MRYECKNLKDVDRVYENGEYSRVLKYCHCFQIILFLQHLATAPPRAFSAGFIYFLSYI